MEKFKVGEEVRLVSGARNIVNNLGDGNIYVVEDIKSDGIKFKGLFPYYHYSLFETVETLEGSIMNKFKVGDKVVRTGLSVGKALQGGVYEIIEVFPLISNRIGINLEGHETDGIVSFQYYSSGFELYVDDVLSPLEAADAILHKEPLQEFCEHTGKWYDFACSLKGITLDMLQNIKLRRKPKTVFINGIEVVAPANKDSIVRKFYVVDVPAEKVHEVNSKYLEQFKHYWATEEDAQKALDAMLIPFNNLNKGDK